MKLIYTVGGSLVEVGQKVKINSGMVVLTGIEKPRHGGSTGRVYARSVKDAKGWTSSYFPSVIGAEWVERDDQF